MVESNCLLFFIILNGDLKELVIKSTYYKKCAAVFVMVVIKHVIYPCYVVMIKEGPEDLNELNFEKQNDKNSKN